MHYWTTAQIMTCRRSYIYTHTHTLRIGKREHKYIYSHTQIHTHTHIDTGTFIIIRVTLIRYIGPSAHIYTFDWDVHDESAGGGLAGVERFPLPLITPRVTDSVLPPRRGCRVVCLSSHRGFQNALRNV